MSKTQSQNEPVKETQYDKVNRLNGEIKAAIIKRVVEALDANKILAVFNEILHHPDIMLTPINYGGIVCRISEHIQ